ncbi:MAG: hypothetical protein ACJA2S_000009 [Cyclobacteriaceae bacterium]|jgi:hypothetical protein
MDLTVQSINNLLIRDLDKLSSEIDMFRDESDLWVLQGDVKNSPGNLCLHLCGNLQYFIGAIIGNTGYERKREDEFNLKNVPKNQLLQEIERTKSAVNATLTTFSSIELEKNYPIEVFNEPISHITFLIHLTGHLNYHLGQVNYHRRLLQ